MAIQAMQRGGGGYRGLHGGVKGGQAFAVMQGPARAIPFIAALQRQHKGRRASGLRQFFPQQLGDFHPLGAV